jgi:hypothetical protein
MITQDDLVLFFFTLVELVTLGFIINRILVFVPSFLRSFLRKVKNKSLIYPDELVSSDLDKGSLGLKTMIDRWFKF